MGLTTRAYIARKGAILGSAALALGLFGSSGAWARPQGRRAEGEGRLGDYARGSGRRTKAKTWSTVN